MFLIPVLRFTAHFNHALGIGWVLSKFLVHHVIQGFVDAVVYLFKLGRFSTTSFSQGTIFAVALADLYDPLNMPPILVKAHNELDKAVDLAYRAQDFVSEAKRMEFLFELYEKYTADLFTKEKLKKTKKKV